MLVTDISLIADSAYEKISRRFYENPKEFDKAFAKAWFKLTHRDMGPKSTYLGPEIPKEEFIWQDPIVESSNKVISESDIRSLKTEIANSELLNNELISVAWASASTYRNSDRRGGANGARIRLEPQVNWECNNPKQLKKVLAVYETIQSNFNSGKNKVSIADLIIIGGNLGVENAAKKAGYKIQIPFEPGRMDATQDQTDIEGMDLLEPMADGFRNYQKKNYTLSAEQLLVDKSQLLTLTVPEMVVLVGGMRVLDANYNNSKKGVLTNSPGTLDNSFFKNLLSMEYEWKMNKDDQTNFNGVARGTDNLKWSATRVDLIFGSNSILRAVTEVYASDDGNEKFVKDFAKAWTKVMNLDRF